MNRRTTLVLFVLVLAAGAVWLAMRRSPSTERLAEIGNRVFLAGRAPLIPAHVESLELRRGGSAVRCTRGPSGWRIESPARLRADGEAIERLLKELVELDKVRTLSAGDKPIAFASLGLQPAQASVALGVRGLAAPLVLHLGADTGIESTLYARVENSPEIFTLRAAVRTAAAKSVADLRDKRLLDMDPARVDRLELALRDEEGKQSRIVCRREQNLWVMDQPIADLADARRIADLLEELSAWRIQTADFTEPGSVQRDGPGVVLTIGSGQQTECLAVTRPSPDSPDSCRVARADEPTAAVVDRRIFDHASLAAEDLRSPYLLHFAPDLVRTIRVEGPDFSVSVTRNTPDRWTFENGTESADRRAVLALLGDLAQATVAGFVDGPDQPADRFGLDEKHRVQVTVLGADGRPLAELFVGAPDGAEGTRFVRRGPFRGVLSIRDADWARDLLRGRLAFASRAVLAVPRDGIDEITVARPDGTFRYERRMGLWRMVEPVKGDVDEWSMEALLQDLSDMQAVRIEAEVSAAPPADRYGLARPACTLRVAWGREAGDAAELVIGAPAGRSGDRYAMLRSGRYVFTLPPSVARHAMGDLASRRVCRVDEVDVEQISFITDKGTRTFTSKDGQWLENGAPVGTDTSRHVMAALIVLRDLQGTRIAYYRRADAEKAGLDRPLLRIRIKQRRIETPKEVVLGARISLREGGPACYITGPDSSFVLVAGYEDMRTLLGPAPGGAEEPREEAAAP